MAKNGHLETLKWNHANGGEWIFKAANWAAINGEMDPRYWWLVNQVKKKCESCTN